MQAKHNCLQTLTVMSKKTAQKIFGQHAQNYVNSPTHAGGDSLAKLLDAVQPQAGWLVLDIATGGGHVALACARLGAQTIAGDLTLPMLHAARQHHQNNEVHTVTYVQHDAEKLPFAANSLDLITCRIAPHHFPDVAAFVRECARVLKPQGRLGIVDIISPEAPAVARYCNLFETLRDPSHVWAYSLSDWSVFFEQAALLVEYTERLGLAQQVGTWAQRVGCDDRTIERLRVMLLQAPAEVKEWYQVTAEVGISHYVDISFSIQQAIMVAQKPA